MRFATFAASDRLTYGVTLGDDLVDLCLADRVRRDRDKVSSPPLPASLKEYISRFGSNLESARDLVDWVQSEGRNVEGLRTPAAQCRLQPPILGADKFICVGKNNLAHLEELKRNDLIRETPAEPTGFIKLNACLVGDKAEVSRPPDIVQLDYEPELMFVISKRAYRVSKQDAMDYVFGISLLNDLTAREIQRREVQSGTRFWTAKNMPGFGPVGPYLVTLDEIGDPHNQWLTCTVNGKQRMRVNTSDQIYKIPDIIEHFSRYLPLEPGDMFSTGSPGGVAVGLENAEELYLVPGDRIEVGLEGFMTLTTNIVAAM